MKIDPIFIIMAVAVIGFGGMVLMFTSSTPAVTGNVGLVQGQSIQNIVPGGPGEIVEFKTVLQGFQYNPDTITVKKGSIVRLTIENRDNVFHGLHLPQFGIQDSQEPLGTKTIEFTAIETPSNGQPIYSCTQEHGETLTFNVV